MKKFKFIKFTFFFSLCLAVLYLIYRELTFSFDEFKNYFDKINFKYLIIAFFFAIVSLLSNSYALLVIYRSNIKINFYQWNVYLYNSYLLDYVPFVGLAYRARRFKKKLNLNYIDFLSMHIFAMLINFFIILISIRFFLLNPDLNIFNIDLKLLNLIIIIFFIFLLFIYNLAKLRSLSSNLSNNYFFKKKLIKLLNFFFIYLNFIKNKLLMLKCILLIMLTNLLHLLLFFAIFKTFNFTLDLNFQIIIYLVFSISTLIKILPKNLVISEYIGASLIGKTAIGFAGGLIFFIFYRFVNLVSVLLFFFYFNIFKYIRTKKLF
jgi:hypothetical protein